ncbi:hypothetical protein AB1Y20_003917 [Prymnesium parvum]|uniref:MIF4G domain-containing protein n=1 Tax=Prymnesium parvum TaxID=97485 RepID=A0AB34J936_PRYPA
MSKRRRDDLPPDDALEQRLVNLIVRIGDKNVSSLNDHLRGLVHALEGDVDQHRQLIIDTIFDCARSLQTKTMVYGTLAGLLNAFDRELGALIVSSANHELEQALDDHAPMAIRGLTRFVVELMNAHVVPTGTVVDVFDAYLAVRAEEKVPQARVDWFMVLVLDGLALGGKYLSAHAPDELARLIQEVRAYAEARTPLRTSVPLLMPYDEATSAADVVEHFDALWQLVQTFAADGGWSSPCLLTPHRAFAMELEAAPTHTMRVVAVPAHTPGCTYPMLHRIRLVPSLRESSRADALMDTRPDGARESAGMMGAPERTLMEEFTWMIVHAFSEAHRDAAKMLAALAEAMSLDASGVFVETIMSMLLTLPSPKHKTIYYYCLLIDMCKLLPSVPVQLEAALNTLFERLPVLEPELTLRLAEWLAFHVSNFGFSLAPFARTWGDVITRCVKASPHLAKRNSESFDLDARILFVRYLLERMIRLSYIERVQRDLPEPFAVLLPPKPVGQLDWDAPQEQEADRGALARLSQTLLDQLRSKTPSKDVLGWLERELGTHPQRIALVTLLHAGSKSVSHLEKLLDKFGWLIRHVAADAAGAQQVVGAGLRYWGLSTQMSALLTRKLIEYQIIDASAALSHMFSSMGVRGLLEFDCWESILAAAEMAVHLQVRASSALQAERRQWEREQEMRDDDDSGLPVGEAELERLQEALDTKRREKKFFFSNFFVEACSAVSAKLNAAAPGESPTQEEWWRVCIGRICMIGRRYQRELTFSAIEDVVQSAGVHPDVMKAVFDGLKRLEAYNY